MNKELKEKYGLFNSIQKQYEFIRSNPEDQKGKNSIQWIAPYMDILKYYSSKGQITVEFGINQVNSTWAFLSSTCQEVHSVDIDLHKNPIKHLPDLKTNIWLEHAHNLAQKENKKFYSYECSSLDVRFPEIDFLFIDSLHKKSHLEQEIDIHLGSVKQYIGFHDTTLFESELRPVINKLLCDNPEWKLEYFDNRFCGITILKKYPK